MVHNFLLSRRRAGLILIDVQEKLMPRIDGSIKVLAAIQKAIQGFQILGLPIIVTEQYPAGLGSTVTALRNLLGDKQAFLSKTTFSGLASANIAQAVESAQVDQWVLIGIEAHVCVLQTAKSLLAKSQEVVLLQDATSSRSLLDASTAIQQMRDIGVSITSVEAALFELVYDSKAAEFKKISQLIK